MDCILHLPFSLHEFSTILAARYTLHALVKIYVAVIIDKNLPRLELFFDFLNQA